MALYVNGKVVSGGGGNAGYQELTYDEYMALTPEQKTDGTMYFLTDVNGDGSQFQPVIYSETEREVGVWTDGKPLYEKTITFPNPRDRQDFVPHGIADVDRIFVSDWHARREAYGESVLGFEGTGSGYWASVFDVNPTGVSWRIGSSWGCDSVIITFRYTKTTDQAGSGTWTPQGVPAVHYSTSEQVVGTWIDGNSLYEKTLTYNITTSLSDWTLLDDTVSYDTLVSAQGTIAFSQTEQQVISSSPTTDPRFEVKSDHKLYYFGSATRSGYVTIRYTKSSS